MSEKKVATKSEAVHKQRSNKQTSGSTGAFLAMVIALAAGGGSYYVWQQHLIAEQDRQALEQSIEQLLEVIEEKDRAQLSRIEQLQQHRHDSVEQRLGALEQALPNLSQQLTLQQHDWSLAEVDYLLRLAEHRLQLSHDIPTTIIALSQARDQLSSHTNGHFAAVVDAIDANINTLVAIEQDNIGQITLRLSNLLTTLDTLPYAAQAKHKEKPQRARTPLAADAELAERIKHWGGVVWHDLKSLVTIRRSDEVSRPLMNPEQRYFLQAQLHLKLETARLAATGRNQPLYRATLEEASSWLSRYYDNSDRRVVESLATLNELTALTVNPELPSLQGLRQQLHAERPPSTPSLPTITDNSMAMPGAADTLTEPSPPVVVEEPNTESPL